MSNCRCHFDDLEFEYEDKFYSIECTAYGTYAYDPGCMYMRNGDPGYPPEESLDVDEVEAIWYDEDGNKVEETQDMHDALVGHFEDNTDWFEMDEPDYPEPDYEEY